MNPLESVLVIGLQISVEIHVYCNLLVIDTKSGNYATSLFLTIVRRPSRQVLFQVLCDTNEMEREYNLATMSPDGPKVTFNQSNYIIKTR